jgi:sterol desaturase/sphingolipid hydroxylase (fatty acid hydroxylase superfamily)
MQPWRWATDVHTALLVEVVVRPLVFVALAALALIPLELLAPAHAPRRGGRTRDLAFATLGQIGVRGVVVLGLGSVLAAAERHGLEAAPWAAAPAWLSRVLDVALGLVLFELGGYAYHRLAHAVPWLWRLHALHHSSEHMDWLASFRQHPLEVVLMTLVQNLPLVLLGIPLGSHALVLALLKLNTVFVHANVRLSFGPLQHVVATPAFHHRHHQRDGAARNFAALFPWLDRLFGTHSSEPAREFGLTAPLCDGPPSVAS